ncbi:hypothetical protein HNY73_013451 [Argiope bruennichi]|uniref:LolA-like domain-containing protein n=1 Tax=Argiope bruennichi TaxID=94029 RepID=A0A8T0F033_ARGBR|nr:hypothetical protein HNY73_013451 [Argiope bruennichi]
MTLILKFFVFVKVLILCLDLCYCQDEVPRPTFPPVFQVEVQGIFKNEKEEMEGTLFYDSSKNRGALRFTFQGDTTHSIYRFDDDEMLYISGNECTVSNINADSAGAFFPFYVDRSGNKTLAKPEEVLFFTNSTFDREEESFIPSYIYKAKLNFPPYDQSNCEVTHVFTKPDVQMPDCNSNICKPTLIAISIVCLSNEGKAEIDQTFNFFRFKSKIVDTNIFLAPPGIFCNATNKNTFPGLPSYFSFSYDLIDEQEWTTVDPGVFAVHKKVWHDSTMNILRMDEFDDDGALIASRVFDVNGGVAYTSISSLASCEMGPISSDDVPLDEMTRLPKVFFRGEKALSEAVYVGTNAPKSNVSATLKLSHAEIYAYQSNTETRKFELSVFTYLSINNFMDRLRWEAFDVSPCFTSEQKKRFRLKVNGPPIVKNSKTYQEVLKRLYVHLIQATKISVIRLSELSSVFDGVKIVEFRGWILEKPKVAGSEAGKKEPDMNEAYKIIEELAKAGKLSLKLNKDGEEAEYKITAISDIEPEDEKPKIPDVFQVEVQGIFRYANAEIDGSLFYDRRNNKAAVSFTYQGDTTKKIYRFDDNEVLAISGTECTVDKIDDNPSNSFFSFTVDEKGRKVLAEPEKVFYFTNSILDKEQMFVFPAYIYKGKIDIPQYGVTDCEIIHIFTRPEERIPNCENNSCQPTIVTISVKCKKGNREIDHTYNFFRFKSSIEDTNVFLPPSGVFCKVTNKNEFPGVPAYFSFSYDLIDEQKGTGDNPGVFAVHKKVWYDSKLNIIRMDEYDDDQILIASRIFDFYGGVAYTSVASLSTCEIGPFNSKEVSLDEMTRLPKVFFQGKEALKESIYVGTRRIHALDYEVWSLYSYDETNEAKIVQDFYFTKSAQKPTGSGKLKLSHAEVYKYQKNDTTDRFELSLFTYLSINSFIERLRWEAFDISPCFTSQQKKGFRLKVEGPPTVKDSKTYQEVLKRLYLNLIIATNVSVIRLSELACVYDGVKIVEFTGWILDKPKVTGTESGKNEPDMHTAYRIIEESAKTGNLSLKIKRDGKDVEYKITAIENIVHPETIMKNSFSGATLAGTALGLFVVGIIMGVAGYYVFLRKRNTLPDYTLHLKTMKG